MKIKTASKRLGLAARVIICAGLMVYLVDRLDIQTLWQRAEPRRFPDGPGGSPASS